MFQFKKRMVGKTILLFPSPENREIFSVFLFTIVILSSAIVMRWTCWRHGVKAVVAFSKIFLSSPIFARTRKQQVVFGSTFVIQR